MMKKFLVFCLFFLCGEILFAQTSNRDFSKYEHKHLFHKPWIANNKFLLDYLKSIDYQNKKDNLYCIPVRFYVFGKNNPPNELDIKETLENLNKLYALNNTLISFKLYDIKKVEKKRFDNFGYYSNFPFQSIFRHKKGVMNVFLVSKLKKTGKKNRDLEYTGACNNLNHTVVIASKQDASVVSHEVGHFFGLKHPHKNFNKGKNRQEAVDRDVFRHGLFARGRNCEICGDGLSDTPAQPHLVKHTDKNCNYLSPDLTDKRGKKYLPEIDNIMSYTSGKQCRRNFTQMQKGVMLYSCEKKDKKNLWKKEKSFADSFEPDYSFGLATILKDKILQDHTLDYKYFKKGKKVLQDEDFFKFSLSKKVNVEKSKLVIDSKNNSLIISFFKENGGDLLSFKEVSTLSNQKTEIELRNFTSGTYYVIVKQKDNNLSLEKISYSITLDLNKE